MDTPYDGEGIQQDIVSQSRVFLVDDVKEDAQFSSSSVVVIVVVSVSVSVSVSVVFEVVECSSGRGIGGGGGPPLWSCDKK